MTWVESAMSTHSFCSWLINQINITATEGDAETQTHATANGLTIDATKLVGYPLRMNESAKLVLEWNYRITKGPNGTRILGQRNRH